jgi:pyridoxine 5-phosphate synthase
VSLFVDPDEKQIEGSQVTGAHGVEIHTGRYCNAMVQAKEELADVATASTLAHNLGLEVHGGHGLNYDNVVPIARLPELAELNIGHSIVARAMMVGIKEAVREMKEILVSARR